MASQKCGTCGGDARVGTVEELRATKGAGCSIVMRPPEKDAQGKALPPRVHVARCSSKAVKAAPTKAAESAQASPAGG